MLNSRGCDARCTPGTTEPGTTETSIYAIHLSALASVGCQATVTLNAQARRSEEAAQARDHELAQLLQRMHQYEQGAYGLRDAVKEIKTLRLQVSVPGVAARIYLL